MEKKKEFIINVLYIAIICALVYFGVNYLFGLVVPFVLGFLFAYITIKICRRFWSDDRRIARILTLIGLYVVIILFAALIISIGVDQIGSFIRNLPSLYRNTIEPYINSLEVSLQKLGESLPGNIQASLNDITDGLFDAIKNVLSSSVSGLVKITTTVFKAAPEALVSIIVTLVASFYFVIDYEMIAEKFAEMLPEKALRVVNDIRDFVENTLLKILSSYASIMGITFVELVIGLTLIGISNSWIWAFVIALLDILPVLGVGTVLLPWGFSSILTGNVLMGVELLILYVVIAVIRNIIEPKFVGTSLGLHPLATLFSMIIGLRLFKALGMFGLPLTLSFFVSRNKKQKEATEHNDVIEEEKKI